MTVGLVPDGMIYNKRKHLLRLHDVMTFVIRRSGHPASVIKMYTALLCTITILAYMASAKIAEVVHEAGDEARLDSRPSTFWHR